MTARRDRLQAAADYVSDQLRAGAHSDTVIVGLETLHSGRRKTDASTNSLSCVGVRGTCTWSKDKGLLDAWRRNATVKLTQII